VGLPPAIVRRIFAVLLVSTVFGGVIFNAATIAMPKLFDERLTSLTRSTLGVGVFVCLVYLLAAVAQLIVGRLIDRLPLKTIFVSLVALMAPLLLVVASGVANWGLLVASIALMFFVFGVIPVNDTIVARHTDAQWRARVYALRYLASLGASSLAVPLVAVLHDWTGGFGRVFVMLAVFAAFMLVAASLFPAMQPEMSALPAE
jgi:MFS family permease